MSIATPTNIVLFRSSWSRLIEERVRECPALAPLAERLPEPGHPKRVRCEHVLWELFRRMLHEPKIGAEPAREALDHTVDRSDVIEEELLRMQCPEQNVLYGIWSQVWLEQDDLFIREFAQYAAALLSRLYRLEPLLRHADERSVDDREIG